MNQKALIFLCVWMLSSGCMLQDLFMQSGDSDGGDSSVEAEVLSDENGIIIAKILAGSGDSQLINASAGSGIENASVIFPPGSLLADSNISLEQGTSLLNAGVGDSLGVGANAQSGSSAIVIQSSNNQDAASPFTIQIPLDNDLALALLANPHAVVIYHVRVYEEGGAFKIGLIPKSKLKVRDDRIDVETRYFGSYQVLMTEEEITDEKIEDTDEEFTTTAEEANCCDLTLAQDSTPSGVNIGSSENFKVTLSNAGPISATGISFASPSAPFSLVSNGCSTELAEGESCQATYKFSPSSVGSTRKSLSVSFDNAESVEVDLTGSGSTGSVSVQALYPSNGADWNDYVRWSDTNSLRSEQTDTACNSSQGDSYGCIHGGEYRKVVYSAASSCSGLSIEDSEGVFRWYCTVSSGSATFISTGMQPGKGLADLVDASGWKSMSVSIKNSSNAVLAQSSATQWWSNAVDTSSITTSFLQISTPGIYIVSSDTTFGGINIDADGVAIVTINDAILTFNNATNNCNATGFEAASATNLCAIAVGSNHFNWIEAHIKSVTGSNPSDYALVLYSSHFNTINKMRVEGHGNVSFGGIHLEDSGDNRIFNSRVSNYNGKGLVIKATESKRNVVHRLNVTNNNYYGIELVNSSSRSSLTEIISAHNTGGIWVTSHDNIIINASSLSNNGYGFYANQSDGDYFSIVSANSTSYGFYLSTSNAAFTTEYGQVVSVASSTDEIYLNDSTATANTFKLRGNAIVNGTCNVTGTSLGLNSSCAVDGATSSSNVSTPADDLGSSFAGKLASADSDNAETSATVVASSVTDWVEFENHFRGWGIDGGNFPDGAAQDQCTGGTTCRMWDWSLASGASNILLERSIDPSTSSSTLGNSCPTNMDDSDDAYYATDPDGNKFLINAIELFGDEYGDEDGICESDEVCIYSPNYGAYQGHGTLSSSSAVTCAGTSNVTNVTVWGYGSNGR